MLEAGIGDAEAGDSTSDAPGVILLTRAGCDGRAGPKQATRNRMDGARAAGVIAVILKVSAPVQTFIAQEPAPSKSARH